MTTAEANILELPERTSREAVRAVQGWLSGHFEEIVGDLFEFVAIETPSNDKAQLNAGLEWIQSWIRRNLPQASIAERVDGGQHGDILVVEQPGTGDRALAFLSHYDTVWDKGTLAQWPVSRDGDRAAGPGIYDMKAGLVQSLWTVRAMRELGLATPPLRMLFTGDEEIGSPAARPVIESYALRSAAVIVFEASEKAAIKTSRKGIGRFTLRVTGRESHAGADYTAGISAVEELSHAVLLLHSLTDLDAGTTVNVGVVNAGTRSNVVAGAAVAEIDVRITRNSEMERIDAALQALGPRHPEAVLEVDGEWNRPAMERSPLTTTLFELARTAGKAIGTDLGEIAVGGGSDGNFAATLGIPVLDGMGAVGAGPHSRSEHISLAGIIERGAIAAGVINAFALPPEGATP